MANRREIVTGFDLARKTYSVNYRILTMEKLLKGLNYNGDPVMYKNNDDAVSVYDFDKHKSQIIESKGATIDLCDQITNVLVKTDGIFLGNALVSADEKKIEVEGDVDSARTLNVNLDVTNKTEKSDFVPLSQPFALHENKIVRKPMTLDTHIHRATILNDLLDAMSYRLKNIHSNTGEITSLSVKEIKAVVNGHIKTCNNMLTLFTRDADIQNMEGVVKYVESNLESANNYIDLESLSNHISLNVEPLILVRRSWGL